MEQQQKPVSHASPFDVSFTSFRDYALSDPTLQVASLRRWPVEEVCTFVAQCLHRQQVPLPRVLEARLGAEQWGVVRDLIKVIDVEEALWVVAAGKFFDNPMAAIRGIESTVKAPHHAAVEVMGQAFYDRCHEFYVKRLALHGTHTRAALSAKHVEDLFLGEESHSGNFGNSDANPSDSADADSDPSPVRWDSGARWDEAVRAVEGRSQAEEI